MSLKPVTVLRECSGLPGGLAGRRGLMLHFLERYAHEGVFGPDEVRILTTAFDEAWKAIQDSGISLASNGQVDAVRELLALRIIDMALLGEQDPHRLRDDALLYLARTNLKSTGL
jgi:hypothetical protein